MGDRRRFTGSLALLALYGFSSAVLSGSFGEPDARFGLLDRFGIVSRSSSSRSPRRHFATRRAAPSLLGTLTATGAYLAYTSIFGHIGPDLARLADYIVDPNVGIHSDRARGPFVEAGANGLALFECGVAAAVLAIDCADRWVRRACVLVVIGCAVSIELTLTRSIWISSAAALAVAMLAARETRRYFIPAAAGAIVLVLAILAFVPGFAGDASDRENDKQPIWDRKNANSAAVRMIEAQASARLRLVLVCDRELSVPAHCARRTRSRGATSTSTTCSSRTRSSSGSRPPCSGPARC